jgi:hypothetical protein
VRRNTSLAIVCADAPSISYGGKGFPTGDRVIPSSSIYTHTRAHTNSSTTYIKLQFVGGGGGSGQVSRRQKGVPPFVQKLNYTLCARVCVRARSSLNTNKAPLTYCQLSEVNLSRINFRRKRFRPSALRPLSQNSLVSNYLCIDRLWRRQRWWRHNACDSLQTQMPT